MSCQPSRFWEAAQEVRLCDTRVLGRLVRWRIPQTPADLRFSALLRNYPFTVLEEGPDWMVSGLCGRIWTLARDYPELAGPSDFRAWNETGTVRVVVANWVEPLGAGCAELVTETRVRPIGSAAALPLRALWAAMGRFEGLIGAEGLVAAARRASERPAEGAPPPPDRPGRTLPR